MKTRLWRPSLLQRARTPFANKAARRSLLTTSYAVGPNEPPLFQQTVPHHFASIVAQYGDRTAVISRAQSQRLTYRQLDEKSNVLARALQEKGVRKGDRVCVSLGNNIEFAITTYAVFKLGAILVPLNPGFNSPQVISAMSHLDAAHLIIGAETNLAFKTPRENLSLLAKISPDLTGTKVESETIPSLKTITIVDNSSGRVNLESLTATIPFHELLQSTSNTASPIPDSPLTPHEIANIQFTSGTTSLPKAAALSHLSILNNGYSIGTRMELTPNDVVCCPPPLFHCFGCILGYMATATTGAAILFPTEAFNPHAVLLSIQEERATALYGVATMFVAELELLANGTVPYEGFQYLRTGIAAGSSVPSSLMRKLHDVLNLKGLTICYGMTETSPVSCMTTPHDPLIKRLDSVGKLLPHARAKVVSPTNPAEILPLGQKGELAVSGYLLMKGYWGDEAKTNEVLITQKDEHGKEERWMLTGDEAQMDEEGYVKITGRIKDLIIRGGENIAPLDIENVLFAHSAVAQASVVGIPDERYGECVAAFVIVHPGITVEEDLSAAERAAAIVANEAIPLTQTVQVDNSGLSSIASSNITSSITAEASKKVLTRTELRELVRERLSNHLVPKYIFWIDDFPKTASGKIQKFKLKEVGEKLVQEGRGI